MDSNRLPDDIQSEWMAVVRRLQSVAKSDGLQVINISILVDSDGTPQSWTSPEVVKIEPKMKSSALLALTLRR